MFFVASFTRIHRDLLFSQIDSRFDLKIQKIKEILLYLNIAQNVTLKSFLALGAHN